MKSGNFKNRILFIGLFVVLLFAACGLAGCAAPGPSKPVQEKPFSGDRIVFLPIKNMVVLRGAHRNVINPITGRYFMTGEAGENAESVLTDCVTARLKDRPGFVPVTGEQADTVEAILLAGGESDLAEKKRMMAMGRKMNADAVLCGNLYRFRERTGNPHMASRTAAVTFELYLIDVSDGAVIWSGYHDETQQALSENLFNINTFFKRKGRWITAREMAVGALEEMLKDFPAK